MRIILQDSGHVSAFLVGAISPKLEERFGRLSFEVSATDKIKWDVLSFRPPGFYSNRWVAREVPQPELFKSMPNIQTAKIPDSDVDSVLNVWERGRAMAAYVSFNLPSYRPAEGANILNDFNCCSGIIACFYEMGLSLDGLKGDAGTRYDFSQIGLAF